MKRKPSKMIPIPPILADEAEDSRTAEIAQAAGFLTLRRFFVALNMTEPDGSETVYTLSQHYPTRERAAEALKQMREGVHQDAGVISCILVFDPESAEHMERYARMLAETTGPQGRALQ